MSCDAPCKREFACSHGFQVGSSLPQLHRRGNKCVIVLATARLEPPWPFCLAFFVSFGNFGVSAAQSEGPECREIMDFAVGLTPDFQEAFLSSKRVHSEGSYFISLLSNFVGGSLEIANLVPLHRNTVLSSSLESQ